MKESGFIQYIKRLRRLNWKIPYRRAGIITHWRIHLCVFIFCVILTLIWHLVFPHTLFFLKFWAGLAGGMFFGTISGTIWQLNDEERIGKTSGDYLFYSILAGGLFFCVSIVIIAPYMFTEEQERTMIRNLEAKNIQSIEITDRKMKERLFIERRSDIQKFCKLTRKAELFYPSHEMNIEELKISIKLRNGNSLSYEAGVPERHANDLRIQFFSGSIIQMQAEIIIPNGAIWMKSQYDKQNK